MNSQPPPRGKRASLGRLTFTPLYNSPCQSRSQGQLPIHVPLRLQAVVELGLRACQFLRDAAHTVRSRADVVHLRLREAGAAGAHTGDVAAGVNVA